MSYRYAYSNGVGYGDGMMPYQNGTAPVYNGDMARSSYSPDRYSSFTTNSSSSDYEYRGRLISREVRRPRDVIRAPTPPPIIKRVVERAPTPEAPIMERVIIRPQAQEIVERVIEQPRTPPPRIIQKEMHEEAPPPIVRTRLVLIPQNVIKVDRPVRRGYSQPGSPAVMSYTVNGLHQGYPNGYRAHSIAGSTGGPALHRSYSSSSSFEYMPPAMPGMVLPGQPIVATNGAMMMPSAMGAVTDRPTQMFYRPMMTTGMQSGMSAMQGLTSMIGSPYQQFQSTPISSGPQTSYMYPYQQGTGGMAFGYRPMMPTPGAPVAQPGYHMQMPSGHSVPLMQQNYPTAPMFNAASTMPHQLVY
ncbi:unnamed protein product [Didymodactylos carnosus]|uniref:Uncharacterized protein n=2 Tax=Didymodactylos carnosus TaxID=1234261 RepID=A0A815XN38_9BILA|nr:unnamed protein product [Didymodactylos carnosus]CAF4420915.1 unnamed protein product [Didymodactylos carnosus]